MKKMLLICLCLSLLPRPLNAMENIHSYVVYYSNKAPVDAFDPYQLLVLDSDFHPPLRPLKEKGKILLGYLSLGEVEKSRPFYNKVKSLGIPRLKENQNWKGSYYIDVRDQRWESFVVEYLVPHILALGFDGVFLDTLDNPAELERSSPSRYPGMRDAAVDLVKAIRLHYPTIKIMMNRGYALLPDVANDIDMVMGESVYSDYKFDKRSYGPVQEAVYREQVKILNDARKINPHLQVYTLDYTDKMDKKAIANIYKKQRSNGFIPYVATVSLDEIVQEPAAE